MIPKERDSKSKSPRPDPSVHPCVCRASQVRTSLWIDALPRACRLSYELIWTISYHCEDEHRFGYELEQHQLEQA